MCEPQAVGPLDENPNCAATYAAFRLIGDRLDPEAANRVLGLEPSLAIAKGEEIPAGKVGPARHQRTGVWLLSSKEAVRSTSLERHLVYLLDLVEPSAPEVDALRMSHAIQVDFFCYWRSATGHGGPEVSPVTLGRIAGLGALLGIDFYGQG